MGEGDGLTLMAPDMQGCHAMCCIGLFVGIDCLEGICAKWQVPASHLDHYMAAGRLAGSSAAASTA